MESEHARRGHSGRLHARSGMELFVSPVVAPSLKELKDIDWEIIEAQCFSSRIASPSILRLPPLLSGTVPWCAVRAFHGPRRSRRRRLKMSRTSQQAIKRTGSLSQTTSAPASCRFSASWRRGSGSCWTHPCRRRCTAPRGCRREFRSPSSTPTRRTSAT
eukprot:762769-Hanusia_phi.AAC.2